MCEFGDADIHEALEAIKSGQSTNWMLLTHIPRSDTRLKLVGSGDGGWEEMCEEINDGKIMFGFARIGLGGANKFVYLSWCGEGVAGMKKGLYNQQSSFIGERLFKGFHVEVTARSENDLDLAKVTGEVKKATGASFYKKHVDQSGESRPEASSISYETRQVDQSTENRPESSRITYESRQVDQSTENRPESSRITYEARGADQSTENRPEASRVTYESRDRDQSTENRPAASSRPAPAPARGPAAPAPARGPAPAAARAPAPAPAPVARAPPPRAPEPEPEPEYEEEAYEEEAYEEPAYEEPAAEEAAGGEGEQTTALYDFEGTEGGEQELTFKAGATLWVTDKSDPDGYFYGYDESNNEGYFPGNYTELGADE